jgi:hypothetical protein
MAVVNRKFVLFKLKGSVANSAIIPLKFQQKVIVRRGQPEPVKTVYIRFAGTAKKIVLPPVGDKILSEKLPTTDGAVQHIDTPVGRTGAKP